MTVIKTDELYIDFGDSRKLLKTIPDASVKLVITSPPYNIGKPYGKYKDKEIVSAEWTSSFRCICAPSWNRY